MFHNIGDPALSGSLGSLDWLKNNSSTLQESHPVKKQPLMPSYKGLLQDLLQDFRMLSKSQGQNDRCDSIC